MDNSSLIKEICSCLHLSKKELAEKLGFSPSLLDCWEEGHCELSQIEVDAIRSLCAGNNIDFSIFEGNYFITSNKTVTLYHGSKSGIHGDIAPISREHCDFGKGFYMGTDRNQPLTLICNYPDAKIYKLSVNLSNLEIFDVKVGLDWALLIAYNRGKMESVKDSGIYNKIVSLSKGHDMIIGYIANDRMFVVLDRFFNGEITDLALINSLSALKLGKQYVALTEKACKKIKILDEQKLSKNSLIKLRKESEQNRSKGIAIADEICRRYRREGRFFDEILKEGV